MSNSADHGTALRRGLALLAGAAVALAALSMNPATAASSLTKAKAKKLFYTKAQADARFEARADWALIAADGTIVDQSGGVSLQNHGTGVYYLHFPGMVQGKAIQATLTAAAAPGSVEASACGGPPLGINCSQGTNTGSDVLVGTHNSGGGIVNSPYYVAVLP